MRLVEVSGSTAGYRPRDAISRDSSVVASRCAHVVAGTGEHRDTAVVCRDAVDHLLDEDGLADAGAAEQADLAALHVRGQQVDDLDAGLEQLRLGLELVERGRLAVDRPALGDLELLA